MIQVTLKDGSVLSLDAPKSIIDIAGGLSQGLKKAAVAAVVDGQVVDLRTVIDHDCHLQILTFENEEGKRAFRHTASHLMAAAVKKLYPEAKIAIGPATATGFYYDFQVEKPFTMEDLTKIENEMKRIVKAGAPVERFELSVEEAKELMKDEPFKLELIEELNDDGQPLSFYRLAGFTDLCRGPHLMNASQVKAFKLTQCTGAYWRGDANREQLCRVYGTAFTKADEMEQYLKQQEEMKKRDHNIIGRQLKYFTTVDCIGQGLALLMPKGARVVQLLQRFVEDEEQRRGYVLTKTPFMAKSDLYKLSGHWEHYKEGMFVIGDEEKDDEVYALRPMTCPFQYMIYLNDMHSYRDLPIRYGETSTLFRNEASGEMHGLIRLRQFTISEGHLILRPDQLEEEFAGVVNLIHYYMRTLGLDEDLTYRFSKWDPDDKAKYIDDPETWERTQDIMRKILDDLNIDYTEEKGEAAFYGPKLDIQAKNVHGKEDTLITVQIDPFLAERFGMTYTDADGEKKYPYIIHRTSVGCYERTLAMLLEKYAGALPTWLSPTQVTVLPISERLSDPAYELCAVLKKAGIRAEVDARNEKIGYRIREAQLEKVPYMLILGDKELENRTVSVRSRKDGDLGSMSAQDFIAKIKEEIETRAIN